MSGSSSSRFPDEDAASDVPDAPSNGETFGWLRREGVLVAVLLGTFLARLLVADRNSFWLDEVYSVTIHGAWNDNATELVRVLANGGVYPPLYFVGLFEWMQWFGATEFVARFPSNVFITLASLFLYLTLRIGLSRRIALTSVILFSILYTSTYYGLEARPYALSILLVTLSSYLLLRLYSKAGDQGWRRAVISPTGSLFVVANAALLLTHVYNIFFWLAQALIALVFVLREMRAAKWLSGVGVLAAMYGMQAAIFVGAWGRPLLHGVERFGGAYAIDEEGELRNPLAVLMNGLIRPNFDPPGVLGWLALALGILVTVSAVIAVARRSRDESERAQGWLVVYLANWLVTPFVIVFLVFLVLGVARYSNRYFVFSVVPLAPLVVLGVEKLVSLVGGGIQRVRGRRPMSAGWQARWSVLLCVVLIAAVFLPRTLAAATNPKDDWRGTAETIVNIVESNPDDSFVIYEPAFRSIPVLDHHLAQFSDEVRVTGVIQRREERGERPFAFEQQLDLIGQYDYLIVPFIHHSTSNFPRALERLGELYDVHLWQVGQNGKGIVVFDVSPEGSGS